MSVVKKFIYQFVVDTMIVDRNKFKHKCCYKPHLKFLELKNTPAQSICTRLMRHGLYMTFFRFLKRFFCKQLIPKLLVKNTNSINIFYNKFPSMKDLDKVIFWRLTQNSSMFRFLLVKKKLKKKKKKQITTIIKYVKPSRRHYVVLLWLKLLIKLYFREKVLLLENFKHLEYFILSEGRDITIDRIKIKIYKTHLIQTP